MVGDEAAAGAGFPAGVPDSLAVGARVGGYRLERPLGQGGMGAVYLARDDRLDRLVALKVLAPARATDQEFRARFIRESRAAAAVDHPHIIPVFEAGDAGGMLYIAMRYVPGGDVGTIVRREGPLSLGRAAAVIGQVAAALDAAHAAGLVHRDVKPANMLVDQGPTRAEHVYLTDFGLAKTTLATSAGLTGTGVFLGTLDYAAPEQFQGRPVDGRTDQYALGCAAFELLTGAPPFRRENAAAVMWAHLSDPPPRAGSRRDGLPAGLDLVLARALAKAPASRYASCQAFADVLLHALGPAPPRPSAPDEPAAGHRPAQAASAGAPATQTAPAAAGPPAQDDRQGLRGPGPAPQQAMPQEHLRSVDAFSGAGDGLPRSRTRRGEDTTLRVELDAEECAVGTTKKLVVKTGVLCPTCSGEGTAPGTHVRTCNVCGGRGEVDQVTRSFRGKVMTTGPCPGCGGYGTVIVRPCPECDGDGRVRTRRTINMRIPAGVRDGSRILLAGEGEVGPGAGPPGDLILEIVQRPRRTR